MDRQRFNIIVLVENPSWLSCFFHSPLLLNPPYTTFSAKSIKNALSPFLLMLCALGLFPLFNFIHEFYLVIGVHNLSISYPQVHKEYILISLHLMDSQHLLNLTPFIFLFHQFAENVNVLKMGIVFHPVVMQLLVVWV